MGWSFAARVCAAVTGKWSGVVETELWCGLPSCKLSLAVNYDVSPLFSGM